MKLNHLGLDQEERTSEIVELIERNCQEKIYDENQLISAKLDASKCSTLNETCSVECVRPFGTKINKNCRQVEDEVCQTVSGEECREVQDEVSKFRNKFYGRMSQKARPFFEKKYFDHAYKIV
jgi:hypothetical protein